MSVELCSSSLLGLVEPPCEFLRDDDDPPAYLFIARTADLSATLGVPVRLIGSGIGLTRPEAMRASIGEALERYANCGGGCAESRLLAWTELPDPAPHPSRYALFSEEQIADGLEGFVRFEAGTRVAWLPARDLSRGSDSWVPAQLVVLNRKPRPGEARVGYPTSSGAALGRSWAEAALRAVLEAAERDALMRTWLLRFSPPQLPAGVVAALGFDRRWESFLDPARCVMLNLSALVGIPTVLAAVRGAWPAQPALAFGSASGTTLAAAARKAVLEAYHCRAWCKDLLARRGPEAAGAIVDFEDHVLHYAHPRASARCGFLFEGHAGASLPDVADFRGRDPQSALAEAAARLEAQDVSCLIADLTPSDLRQAGLHACFAVAPELCRLSVGARRAYLGGTRLRRPHDSRLPAAAPGGALNPDPHPFP